MYGNNIDGLLLPDRAISIFLVSFVRTNRRTKALFLSTLPELAFEI